MIKNLIFYNVVSHESACVSSGSVLPNIGEAGKIPNGKPGAPSFFVTVHNRIEASLNQ